ncbi:MAG: hypothetical protein WBV92_02565 [Nitrosotalea sp.]
MNKTIITSLAILVPVVGTGSHFLIHSAEAKGMPHNWLNSDGTMKTKYLSVQKGSLHNTKYTVSSIHAGNIWTYH